MYSRSFLRGRLTGLLAAVALCSAAHAQSFSEIYVDAGGGNDANDGSTPALAKATLTQGVAAALAQLPGLGAQDGVTVNVAPGTYDGALPAEVFPILLPAYGISIEAFGDARPQILGGGQDVLRVDRVGSDLRPPTEFRSLHLTEVNRGIELDPSLSGEDPVRTEVRVIGCRIDQLLGFNQAGIFIWTKPEWESTHAVIDCEITEDIAAANAGIWELTQGSSSTLMRSNRIWDVEDPIIVTGSVGVNCRPRIFSNFLWFGERLLTLNQCTPFVVNNTLAHTKIFTAPGINFPDQLYGVFYDGDNGNPLSFSNIVFANNIVWTQDTVHNGMPVPSPDLAGGISYAECFTCDFQDLTGPLPDANGNISVDPLFVAYPPVPDLHLTQASPLIDIGTASFARAISANPLFPDLLAAFAGGSVRVDIPQDVDSESRFTRVAVGPFARVDIGGDEVDNVGLVIVPNSANSISDSDALGTVHENASTPMSATVVVRPLGPGGATALVYFSRVADPINQNLFLRDFGNVLIDPFPGGILTNPPLIAAVGSDLPYTVQFGSAQFPGPMSAFFEDAIYVQALVGGAAGVPTQLTGRLRFEFDR